MWVLFKRSLLITALTVSMAGWAQLSYEAPAFDSLYSPRAPWLRYYGAYHFTHYDTLRGSYTPYRALYDMLHYDLRVRLHIPQKKLSGSCRLDFVLTDRRYDLLQIDLHRNFKVTELRVDGMPYRAWQRRDDFIFVKVPPTWKAFESHTIEVGYAGQPQEAARPPWDGGFVWKTDKKGRPWVGVACEGDGAMLWWPCKDQLVDEPDSGITIRIEIPNEEGLTAVANGNPVEEGAVDGDWKYYVWYNAAPINIYDVTLYVGHLVHWSDTFTSRHRSTRGRKLPLDYYILDYDVEKSRAHFPAQVKAALETYETYWGPFPFRKDGLALVHAPYWGMEHQAAVAYGHNFSTNRYGFDYIILHELAHEYWGNSVTAFDFGDVWIHEGLATYTEVLHVERTQGKKRTTRYLAEKKRRIRNKYPVMMPRGVYKWLPQNDMYPKGAWIMHTLRSWLAPHDDAKWIQMTRRFYAHGERSVITTEQVIDFWHQYDSSTPAFFVQYLMHPHIPVLEYHIENGQMCYRWKADVAAFRMPFEWRPRGEAAWQRIFPTTTWQSMPIPTDNIEWNTDGFYVETRDVPTCPTK